MDVSGLRFLIAVTVLEKCSAPWSFRSSLVTDVITACLSPSSCIAFATFSGSSVITCSGGLEVTLQNLQCLVHSLPNIIKVAVFELKHSNRFGQFAASQTVFKLYEWSRFLTLFRCAVLDNLTRIHSGFLSILIS